MKKQMMPDCYDYVRRYYRVPAYVGVRVCVRGRHGVLIKPRCADQYVYILFDGDKRATGPYHPTDEIEYVGSTAGNGQDAGLGTDPPRNGSGGIVRGPSNSDAEPSTRGGSI